MVLPNKHYSEELWTVVLPLFTGRLIIKATDILNSNGNLNSQILY